MAIGIRLPPLRPSRMLTGTRRTPMLTRLKAGAARETATDALGCESRAGVAQLRRSRARLAQITSRLARWLTRAESARPANLVPPLSPLSPQRRSPCCHRIVVLLCDRGNSSSSLADHTPQLARVQGTVHPRFARRPSALTVAEEQE